MLKFPFPLNENAVVATYESSAAAAKQAGDLQARLQAKRFVGLGMIAPSFRKLALAAFLLEKPVAEVREAFKAYVTWQTTAAIYGDYITPTIYLDLLGAGSLTKDDAVMKNLLGFDKDRYTTPGKPAPEVDMLCAESLRLLSLGDDVSAKSLQPKFAKVLMRESPAVRERYNKFPDLVSAIIEHSQGEFDVHLTASCMDRNARFQNAARDPHFDAMVNALDMPLFHLLSEAKKRKMDIKSQEPYLPLKLLA